MANTNSRDMTTGSPMKLLILFCIPVLIGNVFQQLYNMVDTIIVGKYIGYQSLAAVGLTGSLNFLVLGFANGLTSGFSVLVAQRFGAKDEEGMKKAEASAVALCAAFTLFLTLASVLGARPLLQLINTPDNLIDESARYITIIFAGLSMTIAYNLLACFLRAIGDSRTPLYFLILSSILNIVLDLTFIRACNLGVAGAALATVIAQGVSAVLCLLYIRRKYPILHIKASHFKAPKKMYLRHLKIGLPMAFQFSITAIGTVVLQGALNLFGDAKIAAYTAASKAEQLVTQPAITFGVAMANYSGQNLGAGEIERIKKGVRSCSVLTLSCAVFGMIFLRLFGADVTRLFVDAEAVEPVVLQEILDSAKQYLNLASNFFPFLFLIFVYRNCLQGIGKSFMPLMAGVFELITRLLAAKLLPPQIGFLGICFAGPLAWVSAAVPLGITYYYLRSKDFK